MCLPGSKINKAGAAHGELAQQLQSSQTIATASTCSVEQLAACSLQRFAGPSPAAHVLTDA
jgi:hypothetical protein